MNVGGRTDIAISSAYIDISWRILACYRVQWSLGWIVTKKKKKNGLIFHRSTNWSFYDHDRVFALQTEWGSWCSCLKSNIRKKATSEVIRMLMYLRNIIWHLWSRDLIHKRWITGKKYCHSKLSQSLCFFPLFFFLPPSISSAFNIGFQFNHSQFIWANSPLLWSVFY